MRLLLLPISTRRALIYCEPPSHSLPATQQTYLDKAVNKASRTWAEWEKSKTNWKLKTTQYGNKMLRRIPFEEWGLKSIPPLRSKRLEEYKTSPEKMTVDVKFPRLYQDLTSEPLHEVLRRLGSDRQSLHQKRMWQSLLCMPLTAPFALLPIIPNLPFFYLAFRLYSHYRALTGSRHLDYLVKANLLKPSPDDALDSLYSAGLLHTTREESRSSEDPTLDENRQVVSWIRRQMKSQPVNVDGSPVGAESPSTETITLKSSLKRGTEKQKPGTDKDQKDGSSKPPEEEEIMLLKGWNGKLLAERLGLPGLEVEIERAVEQVENSLEKGEELQQEREEIEKAGDHLNKAKT